MLALLGIFWLPFKSEFTNRGNDNVVLVSVQSRTEWQYLVNPSVTDGRTISWLAFIFVVGVIVFALLLGVAEVFEPGRLFKRPAYTFVRPLLLLLILAFFAQGYDIFLGTLSFGPNPCLSVPNPCTGNYTEWQGDIGIFVSLIGLAVLLGCQIIRYVLALPELESVRGI